MDDEEHQLALEAHVGELLKDYLPLHVARDHIEYSQEMISEVASFLVHSLAKPSFIFYSYSLKHSFQFRNMTPKL